MIEPPSLWEPLCGVCQRSERSGGELDRPDPTGSRHMYSSSRWRWSGYPWGCQKDWGADGRHGGAALKSGQPQSQNRIRRTPRAPSRPSVTDNCQKGWMAPPHPDTRFLQYTPRNPTVYRGSRSVSQISGLFGSLLDGRFGNLLCSPNLRSASTGGRAIVSTTLNGVSVALDSAEALGLESALSAL